MVENIDISKISPNPINLEIYGEADDGLCEDIKINGVIEPIIINQHNRIISGHRRYAGAKSAGLTHVPIKEIFTKDESDEEIQIITRNKYRYKTDTQLWNEYKRLDKKDLKFDAKPSRGDGTIDNFAATLMLSKGTMHRIRKVHSEADRGDEYAKFLCKRVDKGLMTTGQAYKRFIKYENENRFKSAINDKTKGEFDDKIINGDFRECLEDVIPDGSVSLILTDPPYPKEYIPLFGDIARFAEKKLCEGGYLVCYSGQFYLPEVYKELCSAESLKYYWTFCLYHESSSQLIMTTNVQCGWKPIIVMQKCSGSNSIIKLLETSKDVVVSEAREKTDHAWQQSLSGTSKLMEMFSREGDLVVDTCVGAGTTAVAAKNLKRRFIGTEIEERFANAARNRLLNSS